MVAEVGVHVYEQVVVLLNGELQRSDDRRAETELAGAVNDVQARIGAGQLLRDRKSVV